MPYWSREEFASSDDWPRYRAHQDQHAGAYPTLRPHHRSPIIEERRPRRRRLSSLSSIDDYPRHSPHTIPIVLPPLPIKHRRKSIGNKKKLYFVRPHDGHPHHRRGTLGRLKDAFTGEGPDVFVTKTTRERLTRDRPQRWQWGGWGMSEQEILTKVVEPGFEWRELEPVREAPWARREVGEGYDFRRRRYGALGEDVWTDARWGEGAGRGSLPEYVRDGSFGWWDRAW